MWRALPDSHRRWIVVNAVIVAAVSNVLISAGIAWVSSIGRPHIALWSIEPWRGPGLITDTVGTILLLPLFTCVIVSNAVRVARRRGELVRCGASVCPPAWFSALPQHLWRRGLRIGLVASAGLIPIALVLLFTLARGGLPRWDFVLSKALLGFGLGAIVTPLITLMAMADEPEGSTVVEWPA
jgi:hypothetical protein